MSMIFRSKRRHPVRQEFDPLEESTKEKKARLIRAIYGLGVIYDVARAIKKDNYEAQVELVDAADAIHNVLAPMAKALNTRIKNENENFEEDEDKDNEPV